MQQNTQAEKQMTVGDLIDYLNQYKPNQPVALTLDQASAIENPVTLEVLFDVFYQA